MDVTTISLPHAIILPKPFYVTLMVKIVPQLGTVTTVICQNVAHFSQYPVNMT